jgi:hypothetical protein
MKKLVLGLVLAGALAGVPTAAASPTVRLVILHVVHGCHVWATNDSKPLGPTLTLSVSRGAKLQVRDNCPMSFNVVQLAGPRVPAPGLWQPGTLHTLVFPKKGLYRFRGINTQSSEEMNLQTLGPDHVLNLTVRVR